ncbi:hypothetical protein [Phocoenobacter skyensis]|uniref:Uncharacterized protein n=1 Tax=Phocoenobacter skyensis TaxID=97481 RepID=A0A1H7WAY4_9PAST|nr:hypothetical protein [Pasteurella skyensis]MDP8079172.1 hypothetical protein [Pasteurella skyensis]MDP8085122.1 hypothetical protein [Pasteurella skyensis]MDP8184982.1 hypothetical protein [Pasteurella skyensis]QLB23037.1 hypothetical protein A6B44_07415 [Pasteurella skyensis]SEM18178.1 hypothetical protein SAMN05444853_10775 [Pasteurella skyensis]
MKINLFSRPISEDTIEAWAKILEDLAKIAFIAMPAVLYGEYTFIFKGANMTMLALVGYIFLLEAKILRNNKSKYQERS